MYEDVLPEILIQLTVHNTVPIDKWSVKIQNGFKCIVIAGDGGSEGNPEILTVHE
jgi:hypothetical protein